MHFMWLPAPQLICEERKRTVAAKKKGTNVGFSRRHSVWKVFLPKRTHEYDFGKGFFNSVAVKDYNMDSPSEHTQSSICNSLKVSTRAPHML